MASSDIFEKNWVSVVTSARMHRVEKIEPSADTIIVRKEVFDDLVEIAHLASRLDRLPFDNIGVRTVDEGYELSVESRLVSEFTVCGRTALEALLSALEEHKYKVEQLIR